jgi:hypothetical protein
VTLDEPEDILFTEVDHPHGADEIGPHEATAARVT